MSTDLHPPKKEQPGARWALLRRFVISKDGSLYLFRLRIIQTPWFGVYLHHIARPDLDRDPHDHPWSFASFVIRGSYIEEFHPYPNVHRDLYVRSQQWDRWTWHRMGCDSAHRIRHVKEGTWTLVLVGRRRRSWGFWTEGGFVDWRDYLGITS